MKIDGREMGRDLARSLARTEAEKSRIPSDRYCREILWYDEAIETAIGYGDFTRAEWETWLATAREWIGAESGLSFDQFAARRLKSQQPRLPLGDAVKLETAGE